MKKIIFFILIISLANCGGYPNPSQRKQLKKIYLTEFKMTYFKKLLKTSYNNSATVRNLIDNDASSYSEPILSLEDLEIIQDFTKVDNKNMVKDSIDSYHTKAEGAQGKAILKYALDKYNSKWLDSLARKRYRIFKAEEKKFQKSMRN